MIVLFSHFVSISSHKQEEGSCRAKVNFHQVSNTEIATEHNTLNCYSAHGHRPNTSYPLVLWGNSGSAGRWKVFLSVGLPLVSSETWARGLSSICPVQYGTVCKPSSKTLYILNTNNVISSITVFSIQSKVTIHLWYNGWIHLLWCISHSFSYKNESTKVVVWIWILNFCMVEGILFP